MPYYMFVIHAIKNYFETKKIEILPILIFLGVFALSTKFKKVNSDIFYNASK